MILLLMKSWTSTATLNINVISSISLSLLKTLFQLNIVKTVINKYFVLQNNRSSSFLVTYVVN